MTRATLVRVTIGFAILVGGGAIAIWGTRADAMASMEAMPAGELCLPPEKVETAIARGAALHVESCAGCHDVSAAGAGPSYRVIVERNRVVGSEARSLGALARASAHSARGGYAGYAGLASPPALSSDDRDALAYWMWRVASAKVQP